MFLEEVIDFQRAEETNEVTVVMVCVGECGVDLEENLQTLCQQPNGASDTQGTHLVAKSSQHNNIDHQQQRVLWGCGRGGHGCRVEVECLA